MTSEYSPVEIARALEIPAPTAEQNAVITAGLTPHVVIAGAGSGKTATMALRVVYLVANGIVRPSEVLGLTFTRKAAGELAERIRQNLYRLQKAGMYQPPDAEILSAPTIATYNSYALSLVREYGLTMGWDSSLQTITAAQSWNLAFELVYGFSDPLPELSDSVTKTVKAMLELDAQMQEHLVESAELRSWMTKEIAALETIPPASKRSKEAPSEVREVIAGLKSKIDLLKLVDAYRQVKKAQNVMSHADSMATAARLAQKNPRVGANERSRFRVVLLDEFQDTSVGQLHFLSELYAAGAEPLGVLAVGDPNQSIYGFRGASSDTLRLFQEEFATPKKPAEHPPSGEQQRSVGLLHMTTAWRNAKSILLAANRFVADLQQISAAQALSTTALEPVAVKHLQPRPQAPAGLLALNHFATSREEATQIAAQAGKALQAGQKVAVLCRARSQFSEIEKACNNADIPVTVHGLGGLLESKYLIDVVALLHIAADPEAGGYLMRLLAGPVLRLGAADIAILGRHAKNLAREHDQILHEKQKQNLQDGKTGTNNHKVDQKAAETPASGLADVIRNDLRTPSVLADALDSLDSPASQTDLAQLSSTGKRRVTWLQDAIQKVRRHAGSPLVEVVAVAIRALAADTEAAASGPGEARAAASRFDALLNVTRTYEGQNPHANLRSFTTWLEYAVSEERALELPSLPASDDAVNVTTVHAAKGLEWDVVFVPGMSEGIFPSKSRNSYLKKTSGSIAENSPGGANLHISAEMTQFLADLSLGSTLQSKKSGDTAWWKSLGILPHPLRGDAVIMPQLDISGLCGGEKNHDFFAEYREEAAEYALCEEMRLAYVAYTRAKDELWLSSAFWTGAEHKTARGLSRFLPDVVFQKEPDAKNSAGSRNLAAGKAERKLRPAAGQDGGFFFYQPDVLAAISARKHVDESQELVVSAGYRQQEASKKKLPSGAAKNEHDAVNPAQGAETSARGLGAAETNSMVELPITLGIVTPVPIKDSKNPLEGQEEISWPQENEVAEKVRLAAQKVVLAQDQIGEDMTLSALCRQEKTTKQLAADGSESLDIDAPAAYPPISYLAQRAEVLLTRQQQPATREVPTHLASSALGKAVSSPQEWLEEMRRPMPQYFGEGTNIGTAFHARIESHYASAGLYSAEEIPAADDVDFLATQKQIARPWQHFLASPWANRAPIEIETAVESTIAGMHLRARIDAVFPVQGIMPGLENPAEQARIGSKKARIAIIDWKTGRPPQADELAQRAYQLAAYRHLYARLHDIDPETIIAGFYYAGHPPEGVTIWPDLPDIAEISAGLNQLRN